MVGLDTSVVVRLLVGEPSAQAESARALLDELFAANETATVSDLVLSETYFALVHHYQVPKAKALAALASLVDSPEIVASEAAVRILPMPSLSTAKPGFVDQLIHAGYESFGGTMATFEKKAARLRGVRVLR